MHIIWKRPDGFQNAQPSDFRRVPLSNGAQLWLHRQESDWYPFQVSGDWAGQDETVKLNRLVNLLDATESVWHSFLQHQLDDVVTDTSVRAHAEAVCLWLEDLKGKIRGNTWEIEIVMCALNDVETKLRNMKFQG